MSPEPKRIDPSKLMGSTSSALGQVGQSGESKVGRLARIVRTTRVKVNDNEKSIKINVDKLMGVEDEQEQIQEVLFGVVSRQGEAQSKGAGSSEGIEAVADNLNTIAKELNGINGLLASQLKRQEKFATDAANAALQKQRKDEEEKEEGKKEEKKAKNGMLDAVKKPVMGFFETIKNYFGNILTGIGLLSFLEWLQDPNNKKMISDFSEFIIDQAPLILGGILAFLALPIVPTLLKVTTGLLSGLTKLSGIFIKFLANPAVLGVLGIAGTLLGMKALVDYIVRPALMGTDKDLADKELENIRKARAVGISERTGEPGRIDGRGKFKPTGKPRTPEQEAVWQEILQSRKDIKTEDTRRDAIRQQASVEKTRINQSADQQRSDIMDAAPVDARGRRSFTPEQEQQLSDIETQRNADLAAVDEKYNAELANPTDLSATLTGTGGLTPEQLTQLKGQIEESRPGDGTEVRIPEVGTFKRGKNFLQMPEDKYFDTSGNSITKEEFYTRMQSVEAKIQTSPIMPKVTMSSNPATDPSSFTDASFNVSGDAEANLISQGAQVYKMKSNIDLSSFMPKDGGDNTIVLPAQKQMGDVQTAFSAGEQSKAPSISPYDPNNVTMSSVLSIYNAL